MLSAPGQRDLPLAHQGVLEGHDCLGMDSGEGQGRRGGEDGKEKNKKDIPDRPGELARRQWRSEQGEDGAEVVGLREVPPSGQGTMNGWGCNEA